MELDQVRRQRDTATKPTDTVETAEADGALTGGGSCHLRYQGEDGWHCLFAGKGLLQLMGCEQRELVGVLSACVLTPEGEQGSCTGGEILSRLAKRPQEIGHGGRVRQPDGRVRVSRLTYEATSEAAQAYSRRAEKAEPEEQRSGQRRRRRRRLPAKEG